MLPCPALIKRSFRLCLTTKLRPDVCYEGRERGLLPAASLCAFVACLQLCDVQAAVPAM